MDESQCWSWAAPSQKAVTTRTSTNSKVRALFGLSSTLSDAGEAVFGHTAEHRGKWSYKGVLPITSIWADDQKKYNIHKYWRQFTEKVMIFFFFSCFVFGDHDKWMTMNIFCTIVHALPDVTFLHPESCLIAQHVVTSLVLLQQVYFSFSFLFIKYEAGQLSLKTGNRSNSKPLKLWSAQINMLCLVCLTRIRT